MPQTRRRLLHICCFWRLTIPLGYEKAASSYTDFASPEKSGGFIVFLPCRGFSFTFFFATAQFPFHPLRVEGGEVFFAKRRLQNVMAKYRVLLLPPSTPASPLRRTVAKPDNVSFCKKNLFKARVLEARECEYLATFSPRPLLLSTRLRSAFL